VIEPVGDQADDVPQIIEVLRFLDFPTEDGAFRALSIAPASSGSRCLKSFQNSASRNTAQESAVRAT
jgi:hypothetical protein